MDQFRVTFSAAGAASDLWAFGEDELAETVLGFSDEELLAAWRQAAVFYRPSVELPVEGRRITLGHVAAFACMHQIEGSLRPLARQRRRPAKDVPEHIENGPGYLSSSRIHELYEEH